MLFRSGTAELNYRTRRKHSIIIPRFCHVYFEHGLKPCLTDADLTLARLDLICCCASDRGKFQQLRRFAVCRRRCEESTCISQVRHGGGSHRVSVTTFYYTRKSLVLPASGTRTTMGWSANALCNLPRIRRGKQKEAELAGLYVRRSRDI